jgi:PTS system nitrogen regulatory IIA component
MWSLPLQWRDAPLSGLLNGRPLLRPEHVRLDVLVAGLDDAFDLIGRLVQRPRGPTAAVISDRLRRRESRNSTVLGHGIALPHAQVPRLRVPVTAYLRLRHAIAAGECGQAAVRHLIALLVPKPAAVPHFDLLSRLENGLRNPATRQALADCRTPEEVCRLFEAQPVQDA